MLGAGLGPTVLKATLEAAGLEVTPSVRTLPVLAPAINSLRIEPERNDGRNMRTNVAARMFGMVAIRGAVPG